MTSDFYCDRVLSGLTPVRKIAETDNVLAFHHTRPFYPVHIVVIPKRHIPSLLVLEPTDNPLILELLAIIKQIAAHVVHEQVPVVSSPIWGTIRIPSICIGILFLVSHCAKPIFKEK